MYAKTMYSKAQIQGHPLHPMLVAFPIAFYAATCAAYLYYGIGVQEFFWFRLGYIANIAGVVLALAAAIPGLIDWSLGIPTDSPAKRTGLLHMVLNVTALIFFAVAAWIASGQMETMIPDVRWATILSVIGLGFTGVGGYLGWKMVGVHHVGISLTPAQERLEKGARETSFGLKTRFSSDGVDQAKKPRASHL